MKLTNRTYALIAGIALIIMAVAAGFSAGYVNGSLVVEGNAMATFQNLNSSTSLFQAGIAGWMVIFITDLLVAWALYHCLKPVNKKLSQVTAWIRVIYTFVLGLAIYQLFAVLPGLDNLPANGAPEVSNRLQSFNTIWSFGLIIFGFHLMGLGILTYRAHYVPKFWGALLLFAGFCYSGIHATYHLLPDYHAQINSVEMILSLPMALAEIGLALWLIIRGGKVKKHAVAGLMAI